MSNLSRLEAVSDALDTAISTANSLPEAGGGGSIETCTIKVGVTTGTSLYCTYTKHENGITTYEAIVPSPVYENNYDNAANWFTLTNVVCNSTVFVQQGDSGTQISTNNVELLQNWNNGRYFIFRPSADGYITMYD